MQNGERKPEYMYTDGMELESEQQFSPCVS